METEYLKIEEENFRIFAHAASAAYITQMLALLVVPPLLEVPEYGFTMALVFVAIDVIMLLAFAMSEYLTYSSVIIAVGLSMGAAATSFILPAPVGIEVGAEGAYAGLVATVVYFALATLSFYRPQFIMPIVFTFPFPPLAAYVASHLFIS